jgi:prepilin-type N-terminal cleavage/methylation domain-containing protein/prepilin-type processing-associated H-X9-DG protein
MKRAFTLIELLVVIAIIAILAAILFPVFAQAKEAAKKTTCLSQVKQANLAVIMYMGDNDDMYVRNHSLTNQSGGDMYWTRAAEPYINNWPILRDPDDMVNPYGIWTAGTQYAIPEYQQNWGIGYGMNADYLNNAGGDCSLWDNTVGYGPPIASSAVTNPASTVFSTDKKNIGSDSTGWYDDTNVLAPATVYANDACTWSNGGWGSDSYGDTPGYAGNPSGTGNVAPRHNGVVNTTFCDGHAQGLFPGRLAQGTNWVKGYTNAQIQIVDRTKYMWDTNQQ